MDVALYEETPRSGYENENMNGLMKIISSASFDAFIERRVARIYVSRVILSTHFVSYPLYALMFFLFTCLSF